MELHNTYRKGKKSHWCLRGGWGTEDKGVSPVFTSCPIDWGGGWGGFPKINLGLEHRIINDRMEKSVK